MGLLSDTNMRTNEFSDLTLAFYVTYLVFELPTGFLMQRLPTAKYLGLNGISNPDMVETKWTLTDHFSHVMGFNDHFELYREEFWRTNDPPGASGML